MSDILQHSISVFLSFFAIMNPVANTAAFLGLTGHLTPSLRKKIALKALITTFILILTFAILGSAIFNLFGITLPALRIAGGILVFLIGYEMLHGKSSKMHTPNKVNPPIDSTIETNKAMDLAISPLAVPLLGGPGTIATAMNYSATGNMIEIIITAITFACLCVITYFCFIYSKVLIRLIGDSGITMITRLMGLILAVIGIQMLTEGIYGSVSAYSSFIKTAGA